MRLFGCLTIASIVCIGSPAHADKPAPPLTYTTMVANGKYIFVMISPWPAKEEIRFYQPESSAKIKALEEEIRFYKIKALRDRYKKGGLYKNDGSKDPLWTVDWFRFDVDVSSDGVHLVRHGEWPLLSGKFREKDRAPSKKDLGQEAVSFFANGKPVAHHTIGELVGDATKLPMSVSHFMWWKDKRFDDDRKIVEIVTLDRMAFTFDIKTGKIVDRKKAN